MGAAARRSQSQVMHPGWLAPGAAPQRMQKLQIVQHNLTARGAVLVSCCALAQQSARVTRRIDVAEQAGSEPFKARVVHARRPTGVRRDHAFAVLRRMTRRWLRKLRLVMTPSRAARESRSPGGFQRSCGSPDRLQAPTWSQRNEEITMNENPIFTQEPWRWRLAAALGLSVSVTQADPKKAAQAPGLRSSMDRGRRCRCRAPATSEPRS